MEKQNNFRQIAGGSFAPSHKTYLNVTLTAGNNKFDLQRAEDVGGTALAETISSGPGLSLTPGYDMRNGGWAFTPYGRVEYVNSKVKAFAERGTDGITASDQSMISSLLMLGAKMQYTASACWARICTTFAHGISKSITVRRRRQWASSGPFGATHRRARFEQRQKFR
jgi:uncharacterized protein with beta-barrel porin domain